MQKAARGKKGGGSNIVWEDFLLTTFASPQRNTNKLLKKETLTTCSFYIHGYFNMSQNRSKWTGKEVWTNILSVRFSDRDVDRFLAQLECWLFWWLLLPNLGALIVSVSHWHDALLHRGCDYEPLLSWAKALCFPLASQLFHRTFLVTERIPQTFTIMYQGGKLTVWKAGFHFMQAFKLSRKWSSQTLQTGLPGFPFEEIFFP